MAYKERSHESKLQAAHTSPYPVRTDHTLKVHFTATDGKEPEIEMACVIVPIRTENRLRFSVHLGSGEPEVRFKWIV
jgi:hypothetical protein